MKIHLTSVVRPVAVLALALITSACAIGNQYDYAAAKTTIAAKTENTISASVVDYRPYILNSDKEPDFVGLQRGGYGNPFDVTTTSEKPLAADMSNALARSLAAQGVQATPMVVPHGTANADVVALFKGQGTDRLLLVAMREWKTDSAFKFTIHWDLDAAVYNTDGAILAERRIDGVAAAGSAGLESGNDIAAQGQFALKFAELLNNAEILDALK